jgi:PIN domain nuclease of toxin-antitoxin system
VEEVATLPFHHRDPFDRMLVAQARVEHLTLVTGDRRLAAYDVPRFWT